MYQHTSVQCDSMCILLQIKVLNKINQTVDKK